MYLLDTNVISESRKGGGGDEGVQRFMRMTDRLKAQRFLSVITMGELQRGVRALRYRNDVRQASLIESWLEQRHLEYAHDILPIDLTICNAWAHMRVPSPQHPHRQADRRHGAGAKTRCRHAQRQGLLQRGSRGVQPVSALALRRKCASRSRLTADSPPQI